MYMLMLMSASVSGVVSVSCLTCRVFNLPVLFLDAYTPLFRKWTSRQLRQMR